MSVKKLVRAASAVAGIAARSVGVSTRNAATERLAIELWLDELRRDLPPVKGHVAILAMRNWQWFGWSVYTACWMRKLGYAPVILYSGNDLGQLLAAGRGTPLGWLQHGKYWQRVGRIPDVTLIDLDALPAPPVAQRDAYAAFADSYAPTMAAYELRIEEHEHGEEYRAKYEAAVAKARDALMEFGPQAEAALRDAKTKFDVQRLIAFSGLIGTTSAAGEAARRLGMTVAFCEGWAVKPGHMIVSINAPALEYNIRGWLESIGQWDERRAKEIEQFLAFQETSEISEDADWLTNYHRFQRSASHTQLDAGLRAFLETEGPLFLLAPNCVGDSATLRVQTVFKSQREWIHAVCDHFRKHPDWRLVVRAHPDEQFYFDRNKIVIMMGDVAERAAAGAPNIRVIKGSEDISTYALINYAHAGLVWMSTVGVDMAVRNCPVLAAAKPKYHGLGIVHEPATRDEYFVVLERLATGPRATSEEVKRVAKQYLTILAKEFSYDAYSPDYLGRDIQLSRHLRGGEFDTFYRILAGELPSETRPPLRGGNAEVAGGAT